METVSFFTFLEEKITEILFQLFFLAVVAFLLIFYGVDTLFVVLLVILFISIQGFFQWCLYRKKRNASQHIIDLVSELLKLESIQAFEERKARAKRLGEEAGTKLLLPMFLMLVVVLIIVIVPAFLTMQI